MNVLIIGVGLIGGSFALALRDRGLAERIEGVEASEEHSCTITFFDFDCSLGFSACAAPAIRVSAATKLIAFNILFIFYRFAEIVLFADDPCRFVAKRVQTRTSRS